MILLNRSKTERKKLICTKSMTAKCPYGIAAYTDKAVYAAIVLQLCLICTAKMKHTCST